MGVTALLDRVISWPALAVALLLFGFAPGAVLRLIVLMFPRSDPRRIELRAELYVVPRIERPFWVVEQLEVALFEGIRGRLKPREFAADPFTGFPVVVMDTSARGTAALGSTQGSSYVNHLECEWILGACWAIDADLRRRHQAPATVSIVTYYRAQAEIMQARLRSRPTPFPMLRFEVIGTIDQMKGLESDYVFVSFCRASASNLPPAPAFGGFLQDPRRFRIVLTRARHTLILVGHAPTLRGLGGASGSEVARLFGGLLKRKDISIIRDLKIQAPLIP